MLKKQAVQEIFCRTEAVQLLAYAGLIQRTLACCLYDKIGFAVADIAFIIRQRNGHGLAKTCSNNGIYRNAFFSVRTEELLRIAHQPAVERAENAVIQAYSVRHINRYLLAGGSTLYAIAAAQHIRNGGAHASADAYPEFQSVTQMQLLIQLNNCLIAVFIQLSYTADKHTAVIGTAVAHHCASGTALQISGGEVTVEDLLDIRQIFLRHVVVTGKIAVNRTAVSIYYYRNIFRALHTSFDFVGHNACVNQLRQNAQGIHILGAQQILACILALQHILILGVKQLIRQTARLGTASAVAAAAADKTAHQALSAVADAQSAMDKGFDFTAAAAGCTDFLQAQLARQYAALHACAHSEVYTAAIGNTHLRAGMQRQLRHNFLCQADNAQILHNESVYAYIIQKQQVSG